MNKYLILEALIDEMPYPEKTVSENSTMVAFSWEDAEATLRDTHYRAPHAPILWCEGEIWDTWRPGDGPRPDRED